MARPQRNNIDYFPHEVNHGKKMFYIEKKYKNDGYAVWHKILEELGKSDYHFLDISEDHTVMFLASYCNVSEDILNDIITDLVKFKVFDKYLFDNGILYSHKFIESITDAYNKRSNSIFTYDQLKEHLKGLGISLKGKSSSKQPKQPSEVPVNPQSKVEDRILNYIKEEKIVLPFGSDDFLACFILWVKYRREIKKPVDDGEISLQGQLKKIGDISRGSEAEAKEIIMNCIEKRWVGIQKHDENGKQKTGQFSDEELAAAVRKTASDFGH